MPWKRICRCLLITGALALLLVGIAVGVVISWVRQDHYRWSDGIDAVIAGKLGWNLSGKSGADSYWEIHGMVVRDPLAIFRLLHDESPGVRSEAERLLTSPDVARTLDDTVRGHA